MGLEPANLGIVDMFDQTLYHAGFDQAARFKHIQGLINARLGDKSTALGKELHHLLAGHAGQNLANPGAAGVEDAGQPVFSQLGAR